MPWYNDDDAERYEQRSRYDQEARRAGGGRQGGYRTRGEFDRREGAARPDYYGGPPEFGPQGEWRRGDPGGNRGAEPMEDDDWGREFGGDWGSPGSEPGSRPTPWRGQYDGDQEEMAEPWSVPGPHAGHGPRGYRRSDERICEEVCERLTRHGNVDAREIDVSVTDGEVTLSGRVDSRWAKREAESVAEQVPGVRDVHNRLRVDAARRDSARHMGAVEED